MANKNKQDSPVNQIEAALAVKTVADYVHLIKSLGEIPREEKKDICITAIYALLESKSEEMSGVKTMHFVNNFGTQTTLFLTKLKTDFPEQLLDKERASSYLTTQIHRMRGRAARGKAIPYNGSVHPDMSEGFEIEPLNRLTLIKYLQLFLVKGHKISLQKDVGRILLDALKNEGTEAFKSITNEAIYQKIEPGIWDELKISEPLEAIKNARKRVEDHLRRRMNGKRER